ncbi:MAG: polysaccharide biosynthesis/export family protein, partial [Candidatus Acidiferrum sp.]
MTPMELANVIHEGLKKYINDPQVTVSVEEINSRRIYVTGEVTRPGAFPLLPNMTVLQALTSAGGFTQFAKMKNIYVLRTESGKQLKLPFNYKAVIDGKKPADNIQLQAGDTIVVP